MLPSDATPLTVAPSVRVLPGAVTTGVLVSGDGALLVDCCDSVTIGRLAELGIARVDAILATQYRRTHVAGAHALQATGTELYAPATERELLETPDVHWSNPKARWHVYDFRPAPLVPAEPLVVHRGVSDGDVIDWCGFRIVAVATPGVTRGSVSYLVETDGKTICFCGDLLAGPGQIPDIHSLQERNEIVCGYHGFMEGANDLRSSLGGLASRRIDVLVPSSGRAIEDPERAITLTLDRIEAVRRNYAAITAINYYFPTLFEDLRDDPARLVPSPQVDPPPFVRRVAATSFAVVSRSGASLLLDCGNDSVLDALRQWLGKGEITSVDACWVTHYHDDHVDSLPRFVDTFAKPVMCIEHMADVVEHPGRYLLPCISPNAVHVSRRVRHGESWQWHEFRLTAFYLPGQTLYHGGLLVDNGACSVFFVGDTFAPTGLDDYCCGNRNFLGLGRGMQRCLALCRELGPDYTINQHQDLAFAFADEQFDAMARVLDERLRLLGELLPWPHPDFGTDEWWLRAYPYEQETTPGGVVVVELHATNHAGDACELCAEPVVPHAWQWQAIDSGHVTVPACTDGLVGDFVENPDGRLVFRLVAPENCVPGRHVVTFRAWWGGRYLGQFRHALVNVC